MWHLLHPGSALWRSTLSCSAVLHSKTSGKCPDAQRKSWLFVAVLSRGRFWESTYSAGISSVIAVDPVAVKAMQGITKRKQVQTP